MEQNIIIKENGEIVELIPSNKVTSEDIDNEIKKYFHAKKYGAKLDRLVRFAEDIQTLAMKVEDCYLSKWGLKFKHGEIVLNKFGKKMYFKFPND